MSTFAFAKSFFRQPPPASSSHYFYALDFARGLAACSIVVWHYQHFVALGTAPAGSRNAYPFYHLLRLFYEQGGTAVQFFWMISGFVFSAVYFNTKISALQFASNRFGRLYPLHFFTLIIVALLQLCNIAVFGQTLIYHDNSLMNFVAQIFMASGWTTPVTFSFNGPIWSVSAEILIYALFWFVNPSLFRLGIVGPALAALTCLAASRLPVLTTVSLCGFYFFIGSTIFSLNRTLHDFPVWRIGIAFAVLAISIPIFQFFGQGLGALGIFTGMVMLLTAVDHLPSKILTQRLRWLGDSTYGIYLWHIPVQLVFLLGLKCAGLDRALVFMGWFFLLYVTAVLATARLSFIYFERPMRAYFRDRAAKSIRGTSSEFGTDVRHG